MLESFECPDCIVGRCRLTRYTFVVRYGDRLFCAPNTEVFICDMCGYRELPHRVLSVYDKFLKQASDEVTPSSAVMPASNKQLGFKNRHKHDR